ncbi:MAG: ergothioneine biosynthesis protein EgtB, partial [Planctomycetaceae bacterium]
QRMHDLFADDLDADAAAVVELGLHHEQQHQELILTDIKHLFAQSALEPALIDGPAGKPRPMVADRRFAASGPAWLPFLEGVREIGHGGGGFCYDNETPRHRAFVERFELAARPVTCGEFLAFIEDGGYRRPECWLSDGWDAVQQCSWDAPLYWRREGSEWTVFTLSGRRLVDPAEPVCHVSYYEADAFARWSGVRLPTEAEWETAAASLPIEGNFVESGRFHPMACEMRDERRETRDEDKAHRPRPVGSAGARPSGFGLSSLSSSRPLQMFGDTWEWTAGPYVAYPGYRPAAGALGEYNGKFMCNQIVLRGGSCATPQSHIRSSYRNFFVPQARWQFSGIRLARNV